MKTLRSILAVVLLMIMVLTVGCSGDPPVPGPVTNLDVINYRDFTVNATSVGLSTAAEGTVFVRGDLKKPDDITVRIVMTVSIDPEDWGGVNLYFPEGWEVTGITSNDPGIDGFQNDLATVWTKGEPAQGGSSWVAIGQRDANAGPATGVQQARLIIDAGFVLDGAATPETLALTVAVGNKNGYIVGPVSRDLAVPLLEDYRPAFNPVTFFPVQAEPAAMVLTARMEGELTLYNGCLAVNDVIILWRFGSTLDTTGGQLRVLDASGRKIAQLGNSIVLGGGIVGHDYAEEKTGMSLPGPAWDFWLIGSVVSGTE